MRWIATKLIFCLLFSTQMFAASYHYVRIDVPNSTSTRVRASMPAETLSVSMRMRRVGTAS